MLKKTRIGIIGPSSKIPQVELQLGLEDLRKRGFQIQVHPQCRKSHLFFAGTDSERAQAFLEYAADPEISVLWCARGGHGSLRLLPLISQGFRGTETFSFRGTETFSSLPKKLLIGYSDSTALMEYVRAKWGWSILHAPMPSMREFSLLPKNQSQVLDAWIRAQEVKVPWLGKRLTFWSDRPKETIQAKAVGGNLTVWTCLVGTPFQGQAQDSFLFLEDVSEPAYRIDRMLQQLSLSGGLDRVRGILLGNFKDCHDPIFSVLKKKPDPKNKIQVLQSPKPKDLKPLRKSMTSKEALKRIFSELATQRNIPVAFGLPVGHGPEVCPMPLGAEYRLSPQGDFELVHWDWLG